MRAVAGREYDVEKFLFIFKMGEIIVYLYRNDPVMKGKSIMQGVGWYFRSDVLDR